MKRRAQDSPSTRRPDDNGRSVDRHTVPARARPRHVSRSILNRSALSSPKNAGVGEPRLRPVDARAAGADRFALAERISERRAPARQPGARWCVKIACCLGAISRTDRPRTPGPVAQLAGSRLLICGLWVRFPPGSPLISNHLARVELLHVTSLVPSGYRRIASSSRSARWQSTRRAANAHARNVIDGSRWPVLTRMRDERAFLQQQRRNVCRI